jgi:hypothetical protein
MKFSMTGQEKAGLLIQVTAWTSLIAFDFYKLMSYSGLLQSQLISLDVYD